MNMLRPVFCAAFLSFMMGVAQAAAQTNDSDILRVIADHLRPSLSNLRVAVDPRYATETLLGYPTTQAREAIGNALNPVATLLGARVIAVEAVRRCPSATELCTLDSYDLFINFYRPHFHDDEAIVVIETLRKQNSVRRPIQFERREIKLIRKSNGWQVISDTTVLIS